MLRINILLSIILLLLVVTACKKDLQSTQGPLISVSEDATELKDLNVGQLVSIPVSVESENGIRRLSYFFIRQNANGSESGTPVNFDLQNFPRVLDQEIQFLAEPNLQELVIVSFDRMNNSSEVHLKFQDIRALPVLTFKDNIKSRETVFENKRLQIAGTVKSEHELQSLSFTQIVNGAESDATSLPLSSPSETTFTASVVARKGLSAIIIRARNKYEGTAIDTFKIGSVVDDAIDIVLSGGATSIAKIYAGSANEISATINSGSAINRLSYALKIAGSYGAEIPLPIKAPADEFTFSFNVEGQSSLQAIRLSAYNEGSKSKIIEYNVDQVYNKLQHFTVELSTEIGAGKNNWFSAYQSPHTFSAAGAASVQNMLDFAFVKYSASSFRIMPGAVVQAGTAYQTAMAPYMNGFNISTYTLVTTNRPSLNTEAFNALNWDVDLTDFLEKKIIAPGDQQGENYNIKTTNRRFNGDLKVGEGFIIGWGTWNWGASTADNKAFGIVMVKEYSLSNGHAKVTLEIKVPQEDVRRKYNAGSTYAYP